MQIVKSDLEKHLVSLRVGRDALLADLHATDGAIQECEYWLKHLEADITLDQLAKAVETGEPIELPANSVVDSQKL
jgi:hypothetical protein